MKILFIISFICLLIDVVSKRLVINLLLENVSVDIIKNFFSLTYVKNTGVAFSFLDGYVSLIIVATIIILFCLYKYIKINTINKLESVGYGLVVGGAIGNLIDRIYYGYVIDFLDFKIFGYDYPVFNLADTFIVVGVFILIIFSNGRNGLSDKVDSKIKS